MGNSKGQQFSFSSGNLFVTDSDGTTRELCILQNASLNFATTSKELQDTYKVAKLIALASMKVTGKFEPAEWRPEAMSLGLSGVGTISKGQYLLSNEETQAMSSTTTTYTGKYASGFKKDMGVDNITSSTARISMSKFTDSTLGTVGTVTLGTSSAGGSIEAGTYYVRCAYVTEALASKLTLDTQAASMTLDADYGVTAASTAVNTGALTTTTNEITATVTANDSAGGYAWYVGSASGSETLQVVTSTNTVTLTQIVSGGDSASDSDLSAVVPCGYYKVASGVYSFNPTDCADGLEVNLKYMYKTTTSGGKIITLTNQKQGLATYFQMFLGGTLVNQMGVSQQANIYLGSVVSNKLSLAFKIGDFNYPSYEFEAFSDSSNSIGWLSIGGYA